MIVHKTDHLIDVLVLRLTEFHYYESLGYHGHTNADCSYDFVLREKQ